MITPGEGSMGRQGVMNHAPTGFVGKIRHLRSIFCMKKVLSNMAGVVLEYLVQPGEQISVDQDVVMLESMKMQIPVQSTVNGVVKRFKVEVGEFVNEGDVLIEVE
jgi:acetyl-CoA carboxylase biotin carboxyl carrier protein